MTQPAFPERNSSPLDAVADDSDSEISVFRLIGTALSYWKLIAGMGLLLALVTGTKGLMAGYLYLSDASFIAQGSRAPTEASALAAQFGLNSGGGGGSESPQFYVDLLKSREILRGVARSSFSIHTDSGVIAGNLIKVLGLRGPSARSREADAMKSVFNMVSTSTSGKTGVIKLEAVSGNPELSAQLVQRSLDAVNKFNLEGRKSRASAERRFVEDRLSEATDKLTVAENRLEEFLSTNRVVGSPSLTLQQERLNRVVQAQQQVYTVLAQAREQARIEEIRDAPAITVIEPPEPPLHPLPRGTIAKTTKSLIFGALLGLLLAFILDYIKHTKNESETIEALRRFSRRGFKSPFPRRKSRR